MSSAFREPKLQLKIHAYKSVSNSRIIDGWHSVKDRKIGCGSTGKGEVQEGWDGPQRIRGGVGLELGLECWIAAEQKGSSGRWCQGHKER